MTHSGNSVHRRKFIRGFALAVGLGLGGSALSACGDAATNTSAPIASPFPPTSTAATTTNVPATTAAATTAPVVATTAPATTAPATSAPAATAATATSAPVATTAPATSAPVATTAAAAPTTGSGAAPAGYTEVGKVSAATKPVAFNVGGKKGFVFAKSSSDVLSYSNICTHKGCEVAYVEAEQHLNCPCHGSSFTTTGEVIKGPATVRLSLFDTKVVGDLIYAKLS